MRHRTIELPARVGEQPVGGLEYQQVLPVEAVVPVAQQGFAAAVRFQPTISGAM
jgi:hypothetical protein